MEIKTNAVMQLKAILDTLSYDDLLKTTIFVNDKAVGYIISDVESNQISLLDEDTKIKISGKDNQ